MRYPETARLIRKSRKRKGLSQERLARHLGCSRLQVIRWEQGLHRPDPDALGAKLAESLEFSVADLRSCDGGDEDDAEAASMPLARDLATALQAEVQRQVAAALKAEMAA